MFICRIRPSVNRITTKKPYLSYDKKFETNFATNFGADFGNNFSTIGSNFKTNTENFIMDSSNSILSATESAAIKSSDIALENAIKMLAITENKILESNLNNVQISVGISLGPISISINKNIASE